MRTTAIVLVVLCLVVGADDGKGNLEARVKRLEAQVAMLRKWHPDSLRQDWNVLRALCGLMAIMKSDGSVPLHKDGRIDVYALAGRDLPEAHLPDWFRSARTGVGPCVADIKGGRYSHFPWARYKGKVTRGKPVPLLWDPVPGRDGKRLVGFSTPAAKHLTEAEFQAVMKAAGQR